MRRAALLLALLLPCAAQAETSVRVRVGDHPTLGRVVFDWPSRTGYELEEAPGRIVLRFAEPAAFDLAGARRLPRNVRVIEAAPGGVAIGITPGTRPRVFRLGTRIVVDVADAARETPSVQPRPEARPSSLQPAAPRRAEPAPPAPAVAPPPPEPIAAEPSLTGLTIPAGPEVGAALFQRGGQWLLVLDAVVAPDAAALRRAGLGEQDMAAGADYTLLLLPAARLPAPRLARRPGAWVLEAAEAPPPGRAIRTELDPGPPARLLLRSALPSRSVAVLDPETGGTLLVGTVRDAEEATPLGRRAAALEVLPTRLGAAILPRADTVTLRAQENGFVASPGPGAELALGVEPVGADGAESLTRIFDLPVEPVGALVQRERNATLAVAAAPPLGRGAPRLRNAEALLALGLGAEAQSMAALAMKEDPRAAEDPVAHALRGAAALLAGRPAEADGLLHRRLPESDELNLWRGLLAAARGEDGAARIAAGAQLMRAWPQPLRDRVEPLAAEALVAAGETAAARRLLQGREGEPAFALARARLLEADGRMAEAIEAYAAVARGRDRRARAVAMRRGAELRLAGGALDASGAAEALEAVLAAWRGDAMERDTRLRLAELRSRAGEHRRAFEALREAEQAFPDIAPTTRPRLQEALLGAIAEAPPVEAVALFDTHAALLPAGAKTEQALAGLAERLAALDLVERARNVLAEGLARVGDAEARARLGLRLAGLALGAEDAEGARAALARTDAPGLPEPLRQERLRAGARALVRLGRFEEAVAGYREAGPQAATELAELLASRHDWAGAAAALSAHLAEAIPPAPAPLTEEGRRLVARTAALLALAGDEGGLAGLRAAHGARMEGGAFEDAFALMTAGRIGGVGDLPRLRRQLELARLLPTRLESLRPGVAIAR